MAEGLEKIVTEIVTWIRDFFTIFRDFAINLELFQNRLSSWTLKYNKILFFKKTK